MPSNEILDIEIDMQGNAWIATFGGLAKFDGGFWTAYNPGNSELPSEIVYDIEIDSNNNKWIGTVSYWESSHLEPRISGGLAKFDDAG